jgi:hypothetical protein
MSTPHDDPYLTLLGETRAALASLTASAAEMRGSFNSAILGLHERHRDTEQRLRDAEQRMHESEQRLSERIALLEQVRPHQRDWVDVCIVLFLAIIAGGIWIGILL